MKQNKLFTPILAVALLVPQYASAVSMLAYDGETVGSILKGVTSWLLGFAAAIAVLFIIWAGLKYVTSSGNKDKIESSKKTLTYAIFGLIIIVLSYVIINFLVFNTKKIIEKSYNDIQIINKIT